MTQTSQSADLFAADPRTRPPTRPRTFVCSWRPDCTRSGWLRLQGELDLASLPRFRTALGNALLEARTVALDLRELDFIDCSALKAMVDADALAREAGNRLILVRGDGQVDRVLELTGILDLLETVDLQLSAIPPEAGGRRLAGT